MRNNATCNKSNDYNADDNMNSYFFPQKQSIKKANISIGKIILFFMSFTIVCAFECNKPDPGPGEVGGPIQNAGQLQYPVVFTVKDVLKFEQIRGDLTWINNAVSRFEGAVFTFNSDKTFTFLPTDVRTDIYPLKGTFTASGKTLTFSAYKSVAIPTGSATAEIQGKIVLNSPNPQITMHWINTSGSAAYVNNNGYASANSNAYQIEAILQ